MTNKNSGDAKPAAPWAFGQQFYLGNVQKGGRVGLGKTVSQGLVTWTDVVEVIEGYRQPLTAIQDTDPGLPPAHPNVLHTDYVLLHAPGSLGFVRTQDHGNILIPIPNMLAINAIQGSAGDPFWIEKENPTDPVVRYGDVFFIKCGWTQDDWLAVGAHTGYVAVVTTTRQYREPWTVFPA